LEGRRRKKVSGVRFQVSERKRRKGDSVQMIEDQKGRRSEEQRLKKEVEKLGR
jgi:UDP-glucose 4-epimerase